MEKRADAVRAIFRACRANFLFVHMQIANPSFCTVKLKYFLVKIDIFKLMGWSNMFLNDILSYLKANFDLSFLCYFLLRLSAYAIFYAFYVSGLSAFCCKNKMSLSNWFTYFWLWAEFEGITKSFRLRSSGHIAIKM